MVNRYIQDSVKDLYLSDIDSQNKSLELFFDDISNYSKEIISNTLIQSELESGGTIPTPYKSTDLELDVSVNFKPKLSSVYIFDFFGNRYNSEKLGFKDIKIEDIIYSDWFLDLSNKKGGYVFMVNAGGLIDDSKTNYLSFIRIINSNEDHKPIGFMMINIEEKTIYNVLNLEEDDDVMLVFADTQYDSRLIYNEGMIGDYQPYIDELDEKASFYLEVEEKSNPLSVTGTLNEHYGWKIVKIFKQDSKNTMFTGINIAVIGIIIINGLFIFYGSFFISKYITVPIVELKTAMARVESGLFTPIYINENHDEIRDLQEGYNYMIVKIQQLIQEVINDQEVLKKAELRVLMEQIKPHFIHNTLDSISALIMLGRNQEAYESLSALAKFYRVSLSDGRLIVTVETEIEIIKNYLFIQQIRYKDLFKTTFDIDDAIKNIKIPKLLLQPLVENSIYHGLRPLGTDGKLIVQGKLVDDYAEISISDNGVGMSKEVLDRYQGTENSTETDKMSSIGIPATKNRLVNMYGNDCFFLIESSKEGTKIIIKIPIGGYHE